MSPRRSRLLALALVIACAVPLTAAPRHRAVPFPTRGLGEVTRVFVIILENEDEPRARQQPFMAELATRGASLRNYHGVTHPSQANYFALTSGNTFGANDDTVNLDVRHLGDLLEARGLTWKVYAENFPYPCYLGSGKGGYVRRHVPFLSYTNVQSNWTRCTSRVVDATVLDADIATRSLPNYSLYVPNLNNDGHDTGVATADRWLQSRFGALLEDPRFITGTLFVVVFDEADTSSTNQVYCTLFGAGIQPGTISTTSYDHYDLLRTIEEIFKTGTLQQHDATARVISDVWRR